MTARRATAAGSLVPHLGALFLTVVLAACGRSDAPWALHDVSGLMPELDFTLTRASDGASVHGKDFRGRVVLFYFDYTHLLGETRGFAGGLTRFDLCGGLPEKTV